jgi:hypothetical protein
MWYKLLATERTTRSWWFSDKKLEFYSLCAHFNNIKNLFESNDGHDLTKIKFKSKLFALFQKKIRVSGSKLAVKAVQWRFSRKKISSFWFLSMNKTKNLLKKMRARKRPHARGGVQKFLRARAGAGVKSQNSCGRGRARGSNLKILAGAGGRGRPQRPPGSPRPLAG